MDAQQHLSLRDYGSAILKRWKVVCVFAVLGLILGLVMYKTAARAYRASSEVLIERPSGYVISASIGGLGTATSTKQQQHFLETNNYQQLARALTEIAPQVHVDLTDSAVLDDISTVIQTDILNSEIVTPVRIALYDLPAPSLLSFQQAKALREAPGLSKSLDTFAKMAVGRDFSLTEGWERGNPGPSDRMVRDNIQKVADSDMLRSMADLGVTDDAAKSLISTTDAQASPNLGTYAKVALAAKVVGILIDLDQSSAKTTKKPLNVGDTTDPATLEKDAAQLMTSRFVRGLEFGPGVLPWTDLTADEKRKAILKAGDGLGVYHSKNQPKADTVWDVSGKEVGDSTDIISITQTAPTADLARTAANAMAAIMVWQDRMTKVADAERSVRFLTAQLGSSTSGATLALRQKEDELTAFRKANKLLDPDTQLKSAAEQAASLDSDRGKALVELREAQASLTKVLQQLGISEEFVKAPTIKLNPLIEAIKGDLIKAETELAGLRAQGFTEEWPAVMNAKAQVENLQRRLNGEVHDSIERQYTPDPVHFALAGKAADLAASVVGIQARETAIGTLIGQMDDRFTKLPDKQAELIRYMRAEALAERQYTDLYGRLIDAKNNRAMRQGNARVVEAATAPGVKSAPRLRSVIIATFLGIFLGCLCAIALSAADTRLRSIADVEKELKLPVLVHMPAVGPDSGLIVANDPASEVTEAFRTLRAAIRLADGDSARKTIAITTARDGAIGSAVASNLAASLALAGRSVTALDADIRRPRLSSMLNSKTSTGLADVLASGSSVLSVREATQIAGLSLVPAGTPTASAAELLDGGRIRTVLNGLAETADMVVIDTPPIGAVSDAALIGAASDATLLVLRAGSVRSEQARAALTRLTAGAGVRVIGVVLVGGNAPVSVAYRQYVALSK